jgi:hypothetical protein
MMRLFYRLRGWYGFWRDPASGRWYAYMPNAHYEDDRMSIPSLWEAIRDKLR